MDYRRETAQYPELGELRPFSAVWWWVWACAHIAAHPTLDPRSCNNLLTLAQGAR